MVVVVLSCVSRCWICVLVCVWCSMVGVCLVVVGRFCWKVLMLFCICCWVIV